MASVLSPRLLLRGFLVFVGLSVLVYAGSCCMATNPGLLQARGRVRWGWVLVGVGLASMDWIGGGLRNWVVVRHVHPDPPLSGMILAGGMGAWAGYLTPLNSGSGPMMMYGMRRAGVPIPVAVTSTLMTFIATVVFFALAGPLAIVLGGAVRWAVTATCSGSSLYDLFLGSLSMFVGLGLMFVATIIFPRYIRDVLHRLAERIGRRSRRVAARLEGLRAGIDHAHESFARVQQPQGVGDAAAGPPCCRGRATPTSCWRGTSHCEPSGSRPTSWTSCCSRR